MSIRQVINNDRGQVVVEYVLLLIVLVSVATTIVGSLIGSTGNPGTVIKAWNSLLLTIAQDLPERVE